MSKQKAERPYNTLTSSQRLIKDHLSRVNYYRIYEGIVRWEDLDPEVLAEFKARTSSPKYLKEEAERTARIEAKKQRDIERKKQRFIEW